MTGCALSRFILCTPGDCSCAFWLTGRTAGISYFRITGESCSGSCKSRTASGNCGRETLPSAVPLAGVLPSSPRLAQSSSVTFENKANLPFSTVGIFCLAGPLFVLTSFFWLNKLLVPDPVFDIGPGRIGGQRVSISLADKSSPLQSSSGRASSPAFSQGLN